MKTILSAFVGAAAAVVLMAGAPALAADGPSADAVENATTAADHNAIADAYDAQAKDARSRAAMHEKMATRYGKGPAYRTGAAARKGPMTNHCKRLTDSYNQAADQYDQLAKAHREMASEAGS